MNKLLLGIVFFIINHFSFAQNNNLIQVKNGTIITNSFIDSIQINNILKPTLFQNDFFTIIKFNKAINNAEAEQLGITLYNYLEKNTYLTKCTKNVNFSNVDIVGVSPYPVYLKYAKREKNSLLKSNQSILAISYYGLEKNKLVEILNKEGILLTTYKYETKNIVYAIYNENYINKLIELPFVINVSLLNNEIILLNDEDRGIHSINAVTAEGGRSLTGKGITLGHGDIGIPGDHIDLSSKSIDKYTGSGNYHGNHTSGTVSGAGIINEKYIGISPKSPTINCLFTDIISNTPSYIVDYNLVATNNSYYEGLTGCVGSGAYNELSNYIDAQSFNNSSNLHVFAAGNDGSFTCSPYATSFGTIKSGFQTAKNVLTVGNINGDTYIIAPSSSRGPIYDGRIKPEIVTKGTNVVSTVPVNIYDNVSTGTSFAAPVVTGSIGLLQERHKQLNGSTANSDLIKALLCNSADDLGNVGPDYTYGFGKLNVRKSIEDLEQNHIFKNTIATTGITNTHSIIVPVNTRRLKVMLYYIDKEASIVASNSLVNDLDLTVIEPSTALHLPLILNSNIANITDVAIEGVDRKNNIEQVVINNPIAGNYTIKINGFNVTIPNQKYVIVYCFETNGITMDYPFGNEKLIPGEIEKIRWTGFGNETNNVTLEYSNNNGSSWTTLDANIPNTANYYSWTVPSTSTNQGLMRISRNGTSFTDVSDFNFTILGAPTVTATSICDGYVKLDWTAVTDATSYEVMIRDTDSMKVIGTTTALTYIINGLENNLTYWLTVRAVNGSKTGRRAIAKSVIPNTGLCDATENNNDIKLVSINTPNNGRYLTINANDALSDINITIKNLDDITSTSLIKFNYSINGGATITEIASPSINPNTTYTYTFAPHSTTSLPAIYNLKVWIEKIGDNNTKNDTLYKSVKLLTNPILTLPYVEDFESTTKLLYSTKSIGLEGNDKYDANMNSIFGRISTFVNTGFAHGGTTAVNLDQINNSSNQTDTLTGTYNLSAYDTTTNQLRVDFYYRDNGQEVRTNNKVWIRGSDINNWIEAIQLDKDQELLGIYNLGSINVNEVLASATPKQNVSASFQVAFGQQGIRPSININPINRYEDGYTFDDIKIVNALNDIALSKIINPLKNSCNLNSSSPVTVKIKNYSKTVQTNISVSYRINNGAIITEVIPSINASDSINYTFATNANLAAYIDYSMDFWVSHITDNYKSNDSITKYEFHNTPYINTYPYLERFETNNGDWYTKGTNNSWDWGAPSKAFINKAPNGTKVWTTALSSGYNDNETSYLNSPCFDLSSLFNPMLSFSHILRLEDDCPCDYSWMEYSSDGGLTWFKLGAVGQGTNWYDDAASQSWQKSKTYWHVASIAIPTLSSTTKFRLVMQSDGGVTYSGIGLDDFHIFDASLIYTGPTLTSGLAQNVNGTNWTNFSNSGNKIASINPNGNNLGNTDIKVYENVGAVRNSNNQYYANRNLVIQPTNTPTSNVSVRFFFTDVEVEEILNANTCGTCTKPNDAYELGVTKYTGINENGDLSDNITPHTYILPGDVDIVPYSNGYYAQFNINSFSEFWLNNGGNTFNKPLPITIFNFTATKQNTTALLNWQTSNEVDITKYEIERSINGSYFTKIGAVTPLLNNNNNYTLTDNNPLPQLNFYRVKIIDKSGAITYSPIRIVNFSTKNLQVLISPNPSANGIIHLSANFTIKYISIYQSNGKLVYEKKINSSNENIDLTKVANGVYTLKINAINGINISKLVIQK